MPALFPYELPGFGLFALVLQVATQLVEPVHCESLVQLFAVSTEASVAVF